MVALETPKADIGWQAPDFSLKATDGKSYSLADVKKEKGLLVIFMCNHCPYVQKQMARIVKTAKLLQEVGIGVVAISSNDATSYPDDSYDNMIAYAQQNSFPFPYLYDETQKVARAYGAVCTPDFFGFNAEGKLQYRGRLDSSWSGVIDHPEQELLEAMKEIAQTGNTSKPQNPSIGCSIKWREHAAA